MRALAAALALLAITGGLWAACAQESSITIGTAGERGVYYPTGGALCRMLGREGQADKNCVVKTTSGSVYNLKAVRKGALDFAFAQSDWIFHAVHGTGAFAGSGPDTNLRTLFTLYTEAFTVLVREDSGIRRVSDLPEHRIGIPDEGSGMRATAEEFLRAEGWDHDSFASVTDFDPDMQADILCSGKVDALLFMAGHPNGGTEKATHDCATRLVAVEGRPIARLIADNPYYVRVTLAGGMYPGSADTVDTFGVKAALVTSAREDEDSVYRLTKAVFDNLASFRALHPVLSRLDKTIMSSEGIIAPLHPGAVRYYREMGLVK